MKKKQLFVAVLLCTVFAVSSCRVTDFTVISTKNTNFEVKKDAPRVKGWGMTVKGAIDKAIEKAGPGYDVLIDGVLSKGFLGYVVKGTPVKSSDTKK